MCLDRNIPILHEQLLKKKKLYVKYIGNDHASTHDSSYIFKLGINKMKPHENFDSNSGLYFTDSDQSRYEQFGNTVAILTIPKNAEIHSNESESEFKASELEVLEFVPIETFKNNKKRYFTKYFYNKKYYVELLCENEISIKDIPKNIFASDDEFNSSLTEHYENIVNDDYRNIKNIPYKYINDTILNTVKTQNIDFYNLLIGKIKPISEPTTEQATKRTTEQTTEQATKQTIEQTTEKAIEQTTKQTTEQISKQTKPIDTFALHQYKSYIAYTVPLMMYYGKYKSELQLFSCPLIAGFCWKRIVKKIKFPL